MSGTPDERRVIVIGSGPAGAMAARELVRRGIPVTMLESGSTPPGGRLIRAMGRNLFRRTPEIENCSRYTSSGCGKVDWYHNLAPGGLSNQWTGAVPRFAPKDFNEGQRLDERYRWPVDYNDLAPYYETAEALLDITASPRSHPLLPSGKSAYQRDLPSDWLRVGEVAAKSGQGLSTLPLADGPPWMLVKRGTAFNSFTNIVQPLTKSPHFQLITGAHVLELEWNGANQQVEAAIYHDRATGERKRISAAVVVVACGPLHSAKLLLDSISNDFSNGLGNEEGVLGRYLHDHPREWWIMELEKPISLLSPSAYLTRMPFDNSPPLLASSWTLGVTDTKSKILSRIGMTGTRVGVQVFGTMIPCEDYGVRPSPDEKDEFGKPILDICIRFDAEVMENMLKARQRLTDLMGEAGYPARIPEIEPQLFPGSAAHYGGAVRMHTDPKYGMLDAWNRMHAVPNVLVCDASCFTTGSEKNPTLTVMALAARAMDRLAADLRTR